ncbi:hypothetical protein ZEAMMB73_Zm00001d044992 [Zea mays]|uniref:ATP-dependent DNA helicase n=1 Tax=Zea mays TaxID=4577 RepID=A0A1D6NSQ9_MAIZE|nr:hypothetical protein ZEAMMB73_Zm00001d044992 [Zea mays]
MAIPELIPTPFVPTPSVTEDVETKKLTKSPRRQRHPCTVPATNSDKMTEGVDIGKQHLTSSTITTNEDADETVLFKEDDDDEEGYLFAGQDGESGEDIEIDETQDAFTVNPYVPDLYDKVYSNIPEETHLLSTVADCDYCKAKKFQYEPPGFCCRNEQINLATFETPLQLRRLWESADADARHFRDNIRFFNGHFSFTSLYCCLDSMTTNMDCGIYTFRAHGMMYHNVRSFGREVGAEHKHLELYFYDDDPSLEHRYRKCRQQQFEKDKAVIKQLVEILKGNPYSEHLRSELGWHANIPKSNVSMDEVDAYRDQHRRSDANNDDTKRPSHLCVSVRDYYCYRFQIRPSIFNPILHGKRLFQQFAVDTYIKIESSRLDFIRKNQDRLRADLYKGLVDSLHEGENRADKIGKRTVLPTSFIGGPRDMRRRYVDAMALVRKFGKPDIFLTMTCNPNWDEITRELLPMQSPQDRPDLVVRIFRAKLEELKKRLTKHHILGKIRAYVYVVEFQKRGLPHVHFLLIMQRKYKLTCPDQYDHLISAEIPDKKKYPELYKMVIKHMMHGPCGLLNPKCPCTKGRASCKNHYPRAFSNATSQGKDSYPIYRRRDDGRKETVRGCELDNRWVVPYNPYLLRLFNCHINVEACGSIKAVKYLFKYIYKGHDRVSVAVTDANKADGDVDEIKQYRDARWVTPLEALWRIFSFDLSQNSPPVMQLQLHLENMHMVSFHERAKVNHVVQRLGVDRSMLTAYFEANRLHEEARGILYRDFPEWYTLQQGKSMGKDIKTFPLPAIIDRYDDLHGTDREIYEEESIVPTTEDVALKETLNEEQRSAYDKILSIVDTNNGGVFFVDGPGGTGKTYLYKALLAALRSQDKIAVATATSGGAASILPGGRTAHSRFKIPLTIDDGVVCSFTKQSGTAKLLQKASLIIWDEASMTKRQAIEALDNSMRDIMGRSRLPFGGKTVVFGGDFRQSDPWFVEYLLHVGGGTEEANNDGDVRLPDEVCVPYTGNDRDLDRLIDDIYPNLNENMSNTSNITSRAILSTRNDWVDMINMRMIDRFQGEQMMYHSFDTAVDDPNNYYPSEFLNTLTPNGLPPHVLKLKVGCPIMLLRNIDPANGLCNGTRLVVRGFQKNSIDAEIVLGQHAGMRIFLPRIPLCPSDDEMFPFQFKRKQFPIRLSFAMTVNKA